MGKYIMEVTYNPHDEAPATLAAVRRTGLWDKWAKLAPQFEIGEIEWAPAVPPWYVTVDNAVKHHRLQAKARYRAAKTAADRREPAGEVERLRALAREHTAFARRIEAEGLDVTSGPRPTSY